jgi:DNA repair exonuclease SbcCD ATPase subunit
LQEQRQGEFMAVKEVTYALKQMEKQKEDVTKHSHGLLSTDGTKCPVCYGKVNKSNFQSILDYNQKHAQEIDQQIGVLMDSLHAHQSKLKKTEDFLAQLKPIYEQKKVEDTDLARKIRDIEQKKILANAAFRENADSTTLLLEQQIVSLNDQIEVKSQESDPYVEIFKNVQSEMFLAEEQMGEHRATIAKLEDKVPYLDYWIKAFGDGGIRSFILGEIVPILNARVSYWLQFLIENRINLKFDNDLTEKIEKLDAKFAYRGMSGGELQRIDLGIALAFAQVMMLSSGASPSIIFLDEVGTNLDGPGIEAIYNTICELARERQVLVTTHHPALKEMLANHDTLTIVKEKNISRLKK